LLRRAPVLIALVAVFCATASAAAVTIDSPWSGHHSGSGTHTSTGWAQAQFAADGAKSGQSGDSAGPLNVDGGGSANSDGRTGGPASPAATTSAPGSSGSSGSAAKAPTATGAATASSVAAAPAPAAKAAPQTSIHLTADIAAVPDDDNSCAAAPTGAACTNAAIAALNHARSVLGLANYAIPAGFATLDPAHQLLVLSNLDRALYGLPAIAGLNATLNTAAQAGVTAGGDPTGVNVGTAQWRTWASNWASGYPNAIFTYYAWMYDDGLGSPNADCTATNSSGCWGHRLNTLRDFGPGVQIAMGAGSASTNFTELYESFATTAAIPYS
jgi:hypothetical protein